jgi:glycosyltransferase involved in cell wall biosynthesis
MECYLYWINNSNKIYKRFAIIENRKKIKMKIYWITEIHKNTLYKSSRIGLSDALKKRGHKVRVILERNINEEHISNEEYLTFPTIDLRVINKLIFGFYIFFYLPFILKKEKTDFIIIDGVDVWVPFITPLILLRIPLLLDLRALKLDKPLSLESFFFSTSIYFSNYFVNGFTTITPELKEILIKKYKINDSKIGVWSSGISIDKFTIKNKFSIKKRNLILMYHGSYQKMRGIENAIKALNKIDVNLRMNIKLIFIGFNKDQIEELSKLCKEINVSNQVKFFLPVEYERISTFISVCDVGIIPLPPENEWCRVSASLKTLEYLAMNKPIIATNIPFHKRIFEHGDCGILIENSEPDAIASAIIELYNHKEKLDEMGKIGRKIVEQYYTWDKKALDLEKFINSII